MEKIVGVRCETEFLGGWRQTNLCSLEVSGVFYAREFPYLRFFGDDVEPKWKYFLIFVSVEEFEMFEFPSPIPFPKVKWKNQCHHG
jgi:hypothetical protein